MGQCKSADEIIADMRHHLSNTDQTPLLNKCKLSSDLMREVWRQTSNLIGCSEHELWHLQDSRYKKINRLIICLLSGYERLQIR